jgi:membrane-associated phospholipid phosphatase
MGVMKTELIENISALGALPFFIIAILVLYLIGQKTFALQLLLGIFLAHIITYSIRLIYYKDRPQPKKHNSLIEKIDAASFPSLHSVRAMIFFVIGIFNLKSVAAIIILFFYLTSILFSRHYLKKHDFIDIFVGAVIGLCIGLLIILVTPNLF